MTVERAFPILLTRDLPALVAFYTDAFDAEVVYRFPGESGDAYVSLAVGGASLAVAVDPETAPGPDRVAIWFYVDSVDASFARAITSGATGVDLPADMPWGERVARLRDPDGNLLNLGAATGSSGASTQEQIVHRYIEGFRRSDHEAILACLTDDVVWRIHGVRTTRGKAEFDDEIENPAFEGSPELTVERTLTAGEVVVITGIGIGHHREHGRFRFAYNDLFTFRDGLIAQVDSYVVPLT